MRTSKFAILAGAVLAASPLVSKAVTVTFTYDGNDISFASTSTVGSGVGTFNSLTNTITVTGGTTIDIGVDETVTGNPNSTLAYHGVYDSATGTHHYLQPANLGIAAFGIGFNTSSQTLAAFDASDAGNVAVNANFASGVGQSSFDGNNNILIGSISGGNLAATLNVAGTAGAAAAGYGGGTPGELFSGLQIDAGTTSGTATITATGLATNNLAVVEYNSGGTSTASKPVYKNVSLTGTDTITQLPALTIIVTGNIVSSTTATHQAIISLTSGSTPVASYGPADGTLAVGGTGNGSYLPTAATGFTTATTGSVLVTGFHPSTDTEIYALKLDSNGTPLTAGQIQTVIADINGSNGLTNASTGLVASTITGVYLTDFPGYSVLLTATGVMNPAELGFDFSSAGEQDTAVPNITVLGVAAVPEPATAAGVVLGAAGLLLGRRKNKTVLA